MQHSNHDGVPVVKDEARTVDSIAWTWSSCGRGSRCSTLRPTTTNQLSLYPIAAYFSAVLIAHGRQSISVLSMLLIYVCTYPTADVPELLVEW